ncbi:MAG: response regulator [Steroidobacteraceae bacterium]
MAANEVSARAAADTEAINILLVDDQPSRLLTYESILEELGHNLVRAGSGAEALKKLMADDFAVILLDVSMPGIDGFETASLIHEHPRFERTPIIFVSGVNVSELDRLKGYKAGAVDYVNIPLVPEILRGKVAVLVELYCKRRELQLLNRALERANAELAAANAALEAEKSRELEALNRDLKRTNTELEAANSALQTEIAERERIERQLKQADRHKDEFLAMLAHELRNPLAPIRNAVEILRCKLPSDPELSWTRGVIERQLGSLTRLVDDLLDVSRITLGKINVSREPLAVGKIIAQAIETVQPQLAEKGQQLDVDLPDASVKVHGDLTRLTQIVGNILANAVKFSDGGGRIALSARTAGDAVEIRVSDTGIGIPPDQLPGIFDLFTQGQRGGGPAPVGLGIGLALARRLAQLHGGTVTAHSDGPGCGSEFVVRLPRDESSGARATLAARASAAARATRGARTAPAALATAAAGAAPVALARPVAVTAALATCAAGPASNDCALDGSRSSRRILVVDDNRDALESLAALMELAGHVVCAAPDGEVALALSASFRPDVVLLDLGLPKLDGYEVARRIRAEPWGKAMVLIALTGWGQDEDRRRTRESGFDSHMVKPLELEVLTNYLERLPTDLTHS